jgi:phage repressor protein C with HTH and peptisase S24 domain
VTGIAGDTMSPKHASGSTALVSPHLPFRNGDTCVFKKTEADGAVTVLIKKLRRFTDDVWFVRQYSPRRNFTLKRSEWTGREVTVGSYFAR